MSQSLWGWLNQRSLHARYLKNILVLWLNFVLLRLPDACGDDLSAGWMASKEADGSGTPLLEPDSCLDKTCLLVSDCCLTRGCLEAGRVFPLASMVQTLKGFEY